MRRPALGPPTVLLPFLLSSSGAADACWCCSSSGSGSGSFCCVGDVFAPMWLPVCHQTTRQEAGAIDDRRMERLLSYGTTMPADAGDEQSGAETGTGTGTGTSQAESSRENKSHYYGLRLIFSKKKRTYENLAANTRTDDFSALIAFKGVARRGSMNTHLKSFRIPGCSPRF